MVSAAYAAFRPVLTVTGKNQLTDCDVDGRLLRSEFRRSRGSGASAFNLAANTSRSCIAMKSVLFNPEYCCTISSTSLSDAGLGSLDGLERSCHAGGCDSSAATSGSTRSCLSASHV
jgi:hypothetical protein